MTHPSTAAARALWHGELEAFEAFESRQALAPALTRSAAAERRVPPSGRANLERFDRALAFVMRESGFRPGYLQQRFIEVARNILLPRMYGPEIVADWEYLRDRYNLKQLYSTAAILFPRRSGKTVAQTLVAAVIAISLPDGNVCSFNLTGRQSRAWLAAVIKWLEYFKGSSSEFSYVELTRDLRETILIRNCTGTTARISSYPGSVDGQGNNLRGMGERLMALMMDEFMFLNSNSYPTILPLLVNGAALLLTSSMSASADNEIKRMIMAKLPDGRELVQRLDWIRACHTCTANGQAARCTHIMQRPQHFQREVDRERVMALMKPFGEDAAARELLNITGRAQTEPAFARDWIEPLRDRATDWASVPGMDYPRFFVALDPAGEGFSQNVLVSAYMDATTRPNGAPYTVVILATESCAVEDADQLGACVVRHIQAVRRQVPGMRDALAVVVLESNLPLLAPTVTRRLEESSVGRVCVMREDRKRGRDGSELVRAGTRTSRQNKPEMVAAIREVLVQGALRFHTKMAVPQAQAPPAPGETAPHPGAPLVAQLLAFKREIKMPRQGSLAPPAIHYTGKPGLDDMVMALGFILLNHEVFMLSPAYRGYR